MGVGDKHAEQPLPNKKIAVMKQNIKCSGDINSSPLSQLSRFLSIYSSRRAYTVPTSPNFSIIVDIFHVPLIKLGFPGGSVVKNPPVNAGDMG